MTEIQIVKEPRLRVSEVYLSVQGEGPRVGRPTVFVRFAGCNLKCPLWPCDTPHAIDPKVYSKDSRLLSVTDLAAEIERVAIPGANICYTGGEPFLQKSDTLMELDWLLADKGFKIREVFTNGTLRFPDWALDNLFFVMDYKLPGSGEHGQTVPENIENLMSFEANAIKFTIASREDFDVARAAFLDLYSKGLTEDTDIYYGVVWGKLTDEELIRWVMEDRLPWIHNMQVHNYIWDRSKRGI